VLTSRSVLPSRFPQSLCNSEGRRERLFGVPLFRDFRGWKSHKGGEDFQLLFGSPLFLVESSWNQERYVVAYPALRGHPEIAWSCLRSARLPSQLPSFSREQPSFFCPEKGLGKGPASQGVFVPSLLFSSESQFKRPQRFRDAPAFAILVYLPSRSRLRYRRTARLSRRDCASHTVPSFPDSHARSILPRPA